MHIWLSRKNQETGKRHLVLDMTRAEERDAFWVLRSEVMQGQGRAPRRQIRRDGTVRYRFERKHLSRLIMAFPFAELSPGLERHFRRANVLPQMDVPELDIPGFTLELYDFQKIGVKVMLDNIETGFMLNDELGLGKTMMLLALICKTAYVPALIVCPNSAKWVWKRFADEHTDLDAVVVDGTAAQRRELIQKQADLTIINVEGLRSHPELAEMEYQLCVTDEFHRFKNPKAMQTQAWHALQANHWVLASGTPILNRPEEFWSGLHRLFPERYPNFWSFERWLCIKSRGRYAKVVGYKPESMQKLKDHVQQITVSLRRRKDQVIADLPQVLYSTVLVELTPEQRRLYRQIVNDLKLALDNGEIKDVRGVLSMVTRAKQACFSPELYGGSQHSAKLTELKDIVQQLVDNGEKAIIFTQWAKAARIIQRELAEFNPAYVDGSVKGSKRMEQADRFNEDEECHIYIGTIGANKEAITLGSATYVIFTDKDWVPMNNDQAIGRSAAGGLRGAHLGPDARVNVIELFANDTVEERIEGLLAHKRQLFNALVERDGGPIKERITVSEIADLF